MYLKKNRNNQEEISINEEVVFIVDPKGILLAFPVIKQMLGYQQANFISILHFIDNVTVQSLFNKELEYLEKRFQNRLNVSVIEADNEIQINSKNIEVAINCRMVENQKFIIIGGLDFVKKVEDKLFFLSINKNKIEIQII